MKKIIRLNIDKKKKSPRWRKKTNCKQDRNFE